MSTYAARQQNVDRIREIADAQLIDARFGDCPHQITIENCKTTDALLDTVDISDCSGDPLFDLHALAVCSDDCLIALRGRIVDKWRRNAVKHLREIS